LQLLRQARVTEPDNPEWNIWLASVYTRAVRDVFFAREPGDGHRSFMSTPRQRAVGRFEFGVPLPLAEKLKDELEASPDVPLVGEIGELLVEQVAQFERVAQLKTLTPELVRSAAFGRSLLKRAQALEPSNPRWRRQ
jgi:hypothetical protein